MSIAATIRATLDSLSHFYDREDAWLWLLSPQKLLDGRVPFDLILASNPDPVRQVLAEITDEVYL